MDDPTEALSKGLSEFIASDTSSFTCGGSIAIHDASPSVDSASPSITLRWENKEHASSTLRFPIGTRDRSQFLRLVRDCQPASFGHHGKAVLDPTYRKAVAMDSSMFDTSFCPYRLGIIDRAVQVLLPNAVDTGVAGGSVVADLYKLNIYQGPSGLFKAHVDTPRSEAQFGSLVVCLPCQHHGGQLTVKHGGHEVNYDWTTNEGDAPALKWAAFYSDCEHEVRKVTSGYRVTLTYNLFFKPWAADETLGLACGPAPIDVSSLPLYAVIQRALADPDFMTEGKFTMCHSPGTSLTLQPGGTLGVYCSHAYAYSTATTTWRRSDDAGPRTPLKGTDQALFAVFQALDLDVSVRPILKDDGKVDYYDEEDEDSEVESHFVGDRMGKIRLTDSGGDDDCSRRDILEEYGKPVVGINWITEPKHKHLALVHLTYGNEPGIDAQYACPALLVEVPSAAQRKLPALSLD